MGDEDARLTPGDEEAPLYASSRLSREKGENVNSRSSFGFESTGQLWVKFGDK